jgi:hypothetical protein
MGDCDGLDFAVFGKYSDESPVPNSYFSDVSDLFIESAGSLTVRPTTSDMLNSIAVFIKVTDASNDLVTNWVCFMILADGETTDFCTNYCDSYGVEPITPFPEPDLGYYIISDFGEDFLYGEGYGY